jgi:uncharacterized protein (DUF305 family)
MKTLLLATALLTIVAAGACSDGPSMSNNPMGPSAVAEGAGSSGTGAMPGMGMAVASEFDYLTRMIPHHDEAIATARILQQGTERQEMRGFAASIIDTQSAEVQLMKEWLAVWYPGRDTRASYQPMMRDLTGLSGSALDRAFLEDMIPHHMMAVMMSQQLLASSLPRHATVDPFARNIRDTQRNEIQMMSAWLREWFGMAPRMH